MTPSQVRGYMLCDWRHLTFYDTKFSIQASDILATGFIAYMFSPQDAHNFLALLLRTPDFLRHYRMSYSQGVWYIMQNPPYFPPPPPGIPPQSLMLPLDYNVCSTQGTVVPQRRWTPADEIDVRRYVESATLQLPIYFVNRNGGVGFWLPDILQGRDHDLYHGDRQASLGGKSTTFLRINVSLYTWAGCKDFNYILRSLLLHSGQVVDTGRDRYQLRMRRMPGTQSHVPDS